ncbi:hypothetical protein [Actinoplanes sp. NPDC051411]|uniref:hypothetical protein n=1 Tax=Actinoplanes sp. NPDC051411 TaxID=3155522 RepID=UPI00341653C9
MVRDEDIGRRLYRPIQLYNTLGEQVEVSLGQVRVIIETVDASPPVWTARLIWEEIRNTGRHDISENLVNSVLNAMQPTDLLD